MALSTATKIAIGVLATGAVVGGGVAYAKSAEDKRLREAKKKKKKGLPSAKAESELRGVYEDGAVLNASPWVVGQIQTPIYLRSGWDPQPAQEGDPTVGDKVPYLAVKNPPEPLGDGKIRPLEYAAITDADVRLDGPLSISDWSPAAALARLVTNISGPATKSGYELLVAEVGKSGTNWEDPATKDQIIARVATVVAPNADWTRGLQPYIYGDPYSKVWMGLELIGTLANQSFYNKQAMGGA